MMTVEKNTPRPTCLQDASMILILSAEVMVFPFVVQ